MICAVMYRRSMPISVASMALPPLRLRCYECLEKDFVGAKHDWQLLFKDSKVGI